MDEGEGCGCLLLLVVPLWIVGMVIAVVLSWELDRSLRWATIRGLLGWIWVAYHYLI